MNFVKHKTKLSIIKHQSRSRHSTMSTKTKDFIQKICYKKTASVDMTKHGFINDNKLYAVNLMLQPLREKLAKICGKHTDEDVLRGSSRKSSPMRKYKTTGSKMSRTRNLKDDRVKLKDKIKKSRV